MEVVIYGRGMTDYVMFDHGACWLRGEDHSTYLEPMIVTRSIQFWDGILFYFSKYFLMICCVLVVNYNLYYWKQQLDNIQICKSATVFVSTRDSKNKEKNRHRPA